MSILNNDIIYESQNLKLYKRKQLIMLLETDNGFFRDENKQYLGNIVNGYLYYDNKIKKILPMFKVVEQVFQDGRIWRWIWTEEGYTYEVIN